MQKQTVVKILLCNIRGLKSAAAHATSNYSLYPGNGSIGDKVIDDKSLGRFQASDAIVNLGRLDIKPLGSIRLDASVIPSG